MEKVASFCKMCGKELKSEERPLALCAACRETKGEKPLEKVISEGMTAAQGAFDNLPAVASFFVGLAAILNYVVYDVLVGRFTLNFFMRIEDEFMSFSWLLAGLVLGIIGLLRPKRRRALSYLGILMILITMALRSQFWAQG